MVKDTSKKKRRPLTERQLEILQMIALGEPFKCIASAKGITERTVMMYAACIRDRLGARSTAHAVAIAVKHGIIDVPD